MTNHSSPVTVDLLVAEIRKIRRQLGGFDYATCEVDLAERLLAGILAPAQCAGIGEFATAILHGDDEHRGWLLEAARAFEAGEPLPAVRGSGAAQSTRTCATCHAVLADGPQPAATYVAQPQPSRETLKRILVDMIQRNSRNLVVVDYETTVDYIIAALTSTDSGGSDV